MQALLWQLCLLQGGSVPMPVNRRGQASCWGKSGQRCRSLASIRVCRAFQSFQRPILLFLPMAVWRGPPNAAEKGGSENWIPYWSLCPCSPHLLPCWQGAVEGAACPWGCMPIIKPAKVPREPGTCHHPQVTACYHRLWHSPTHLAAPRVPASGASAAHAPPCGLLGIVSDSPRPSLLCSRRVVCAKTWQRTSMGKLRLHIWLFTEPRGNSFGL